jgi:hypothetical protein
MEGIPIEQNSSLFSPTDSLASAQQQQQPLTIHIAQQTRKSLIFIFILILIF